MPQSRRTYFFFAATAYLLFVVYGSLVPLNFTPRPFDVALRDFLHIRYLRLGADSRADWVANIVLYIPLAYLWLGFLVGWGRYFWQGLASIVTFVFCVALSVAIEFSQQFFPPRTVSLNDLIAEVLGTVIGITLWWISGRKLRSLFETLLAEGRNAAYAGLILYSIAYLAFSLFPYDFLVSAAEMRAKFAAGFFHWLPSQTSCGGSLRCGAKLIVEAAAVIPLGLLMGFVSHGAGASIVFLAAAVGLMLGVAIETLQFFLVSGTTMGASIFTRISGVAVGAGLGSMLRKSSLWPMLYLLRPLMPIIGIVYTFLLVAVSWLGKGPLLSLDDGLKRSSEIYFMPFYYHYYTTESAAMTSLLAAVAMYLPIGFQFWIWRVTQMREFAMRGATQAGFVAALVAFGIELSKLFLGGARPDPTNILIGGVSAAVGFLGLSMCTKASLNLDTANGNFVADQSHGR